MQSTTLMRISRILLTPGVDTALASESPAFKQAALGTTQGLLSGYTVQNPKSRKETAKSVETNGAVQPSRIQRITTALRLESGERRYPYTRRE
jgi:hypothetical protein